MTINTVTQVVTPCSHLEQSGHTDGACGRTLQQKDASMVANTANTLVLSHGEFCGSEYCCSTTAPTAQNSCHTVYMDHRI